MLRLPIYLDHHATTPVDPRVMDAMLPWFTEKFGNAASVNHRFGWEAAEAVEIARGQLADLLHASAQSVIFTSGGTESNNLAIKGVLQAAGEGSHFITTAAEHRSVLDPAKALARRGFDVTVLPVDEYARVDPNAVRAAIRPETRLVSVIFANNEVGSINAIEEIGRICREKNVLLHSDAVQAVGKIPVDLESLPVDLMSFTAHKICGPKGIGALYVRRGEPRIALQAQLDGGGHERRLRSGTLPVPLIVGFGAACGLASASLADEHDRLQRLRDRLWEKLQSELPGLHLNGHPTERLAGNLNISIEGVDGEALMNSMKDIAVSSGSACTSADPEPSHVLRAMGRSDTLTRASLRFGLGRFTTEEEIDYAASYVIDRVRQLRAVDSANCQAG